MAEFFDEDELYRNIPVHECFEYINDNKGFVYLSSVWTSAGLLIPIAHSDTPAYLRIPREECIKMVNDILHLDMVREICESLNKRNNTAIDKK